MRASSPPGGPASPRRRSGARGARLFRLARAAERLFRRLGVPDRRRLHQARQLRQCARRPPGFPRRLHQRLDAGAGFSDVRAEAERFYGQRTSDDLPPDAARRARTSTSTLADAGYRALDPSSVMTATLGRRARHADVRIDAGATPALAERGHLRQRRRAPHRATHDAIVRSIALPVACATWVEEAARSATGSASSTAARSACSTSSSRRRLAQKAAAEKSPRR